MADVFKKLNLKDQSEIVVLHAPESFEAELGSLQSAVVHRKLKPQHALQFGLAFVTQEKVLDEVSAAMTKQANGDALIWIAYPKKSSKKYHCEFKRPLHNCSERSKFTSRNTPVRLYSEYRRSEIRPRSKLCRGLFNRDSEWRVLSEAGYETVRMVAIDEDWSALRFRKSEFVGE